MCRVFKHAGERYVKSFLETSIWTKYVLPPSQNKYNFRIEHANQCKITKIPLVFYDELMRY